MKFPKLYFSMASCLLFLHSYAKPFVPQSPESIGKESLSFIENKGQVTDQFNHHRNDIDFAIKNGNFRVFIGDGQVHYQWSKVISAVPETKNESKNYWEEKDLFRDNIIKGITTETYRLDVTLVGANKNAQVMASDKATYSEKYITSSFSGDVSSYERITYKDVYPNIDWTFYIKDNQLKYDFIVHPGGNIADIKIRYNGADAVLLDSKKAITAYTPFGNIVEDKPYTYDKQTGEEIASSYILNEKTLSFAVNTSAAKGDIIIDPTLNWATYYGGTGDDMICDVTADANGNAYICGWTQSSTNIATTGAHKTTITGSYDSFIGKFNAAGARTWGTYFGGADQDWLYSIKLDTAGNLYISGETNSSGMATSGVHQTTLGGNFDAILLKMTPAGSLIWSTYFGGSGQEDANVACDGAGNVYICGETWSTSGIATTGAFKTSWSGGWDSYLAKFSTNGARIWSTYLGSASDDAGLVVGCDASNNVYLAGVTLSASGIATTGAFQTTLGGLTDVFVSKFNSTGTQLWSTYFGGNGDDFIHGLECDASTFYISGYTLSSNNIATAGVHQPTYGGSQDAFVARFTLAGARQWGTYYGGSNSEALHGIRIHSNGHVFSQGQSSSTSGIATTGAYQTTLAGSRDYIIAEFTPNGTLAWGTYFGGPGIEFTNWWAHAGPVSGHSWGPGGQLDIGGNGKLYVIGLTNSTTGIATAGAFKTSIPSNITSSFLTSWQLPDTTVEILQPFTDTSICQGQTISLAYTVNSSFASGNTFTVHLSDASGSFASPTILGMASGTSSGVLTSVVIPQTVAPGNGYRIRIVASNPARISEDNGVDIRIKALPIITASSNSPVCTSDTLQLSATSSINGTTYGWTGPNAYTAANVQNPQRTGLTMADAGDYIVAGMADGCIGVDTTIVVITAVPPAPMISLYANPGVNIRSNDEVTFTVITESSCSTLKYKWFKNGVLIPNVTGTSWATTGLMYGDKISVEVICEDVCASGNKASDTLTIGFPSHIGNARQQSSLTIYPNPNNGSFTVNGVTGTNVKAEILNVIGQIVYTQQVKVVNKEINVNSELSEGVYFVRITDDNGQQSTRKFIISE